MMIEQVQAALEQIAESSAFSDDATGLVEQWEAARAGVEVVEPILRFMEGHPSMDYGIPGPLVHFVEKFYGHGYEDSLVESLARRPTTQTVWMLNRVINGTRDPPDRVRLTRLMADAEAHPRADEPTRRRAKHFLEQLHR